MPDQAVAPAALCCQAGGCIRAWHSSGNGRGKAREVTVRNNLPAREDVCLTPTRTQETLVSMAPATDLVRRVCRVGMLEPHDEGERFPVCDVLYVQPELTPVDFQRLIIELQNACVKLHL